YSGKVAPTDTKLKWSLATGTPCEISFDEEGEMTGNCTVPGEEPCALSSKDPEAPGEECFEFPDFPDFWGRGCGDRGGARLACSNTLQNGCEFMSTCAFAGPLLVAGELSVSASSERNRMDFTGIGDWECFVEEATSEEADPESELYDYRVEGEWYGDCTVPGTDSACRDSFDPENPSVDALRGLQVFFTERPAVE